MNGNVVFFLKKMTPVVITAYEHLDNLMFSWGYKPRYILDCSLTLDFHLWNIGNRNRNCNYFVLFKNTTVSTINNYCEQFSLNQICSSHLIWIREKLIPRVGYLCEKPYKSVFWRNMDHLRTLELWKQWLMCYLIGAQKAEVLRIMWTIETQLRRFWRELC